MDFARADIAEDQVTHPILDNKLTPLRQLCMSGCNLVDGHLDMIVNRLQQLESLDISFNLFTGGKLLQFLSQVVHSSKKFKKHTHNVSVLSSPLHSLNISGHRLSTEPFQTVNQVLPKIVKLTNISHLDLSWMDFETVSLRSIIEALKFSRSI